MSKVNREQLRDSAINAATLNALIAKASGASLISKIAAVEACKSNPYQPSLVWHPTIFGSMMQLDLRETVSQQIFITDVFDPDLLWFLTCVVNEGMCAVDGGAHIGFFSIALGLLVGPAGRVEAFEPVPTTKGHLEVNVRNTGLSNIRIHELALWSKPAILKFNDWGPSLSAYSGVTRPRLLGSVDTEPRILSIAATSLDAFVEASGVPPDIVKLDVESAEYQTISGMESLFEKCPPILIVEIGDFDHLIEGHEVPTSRSVLQLLLNHSYELFDVRNCRLIPHDLQDRRYDYGNIIAVPSSRTDEIISRTKSGQE